MKTSLIAVATIVIETLQITGRQAAIPRPEYPQPQFERADWLTLNGPWQFEFDDKELALARLGGSGRGVLTLWLPALAGRGPRGALLPPEGGSHMDRNVR